MQLDMPFPEQRAPNLPYVVIVNALQYPFECIEFASRGHYHTDSCQSIDCLY